MIRKLDFIGNVHSFVALLFRFIPEFTNAYKYRVSGHLLYTEAYQGVKFKNI